MNWGWLAFFFKIGRLIIQTDCHPTSEIRANMGYSFDTFSPRGNCAVSVLASMPQHHQWNWPAFSAYEGLDLCISQDCSHYNRLHIFCFVFCLGNPFQSCWYWKLPDSFAASFWCAKAWCDSMATGPGMVRWDALQQRETSIFVCIKNLGLEIEEFLHPKMSRW